MDQLGDTQLLAGSRRGDPRLGLVDDQPDRVLAAQQRIVDGVDAGIDIQGASNPRFSHDIQLQSRIVKDEFCIGGQAIDLVLDRYQHVAQAGLLQDYLHATLRAFHAEQIRQDLRVVDIRAGISLGRVRDDKRERLAEHLTGHLRLGTDIQDLRLDLLYDQRHFPIGEGLQLGAQVDQRGIDLELTSHLAGLSGNRCAFQPEVGFLDRLVDLCGEQVQIMIGDALVEDDHRWDLGAQPGRPDLTR